MAVPKKKKSLARVRIRRYVLLGLKTKFLSLYINTYKNKQVWLSSLSFLSKL